MSRKLGTPSGRWLQCIRQHQRCAAGALGVLRIGAHRVSIVECLVNSRLGRLDSWNWYRWRVAVVRVRVVRTTAKVLQEG